MNVSLIIWIRDDAIAGKQLTLMSSAVSNAVSAVGKDAGCSPCRYTYLSERSIFAIKSKRL